MDIGKKKFEKSQKSQGIWEKLKEFEKKLNQKTWKEFEKSEGFRNSQRGVTLKKKSQKKRNCKISKISRSLKKVDKSEKIANLKKVDKGVPWDNKFFEKSWKKKVLNCYFIFSWKQSQKKLVRTRGKRIEDDIYTFFQ